MTLLGRGEYGEVYLLNNWKEGKLRVLTELRKAMTNCAIDGSTRIGKHLEFNVAIKRMSTSYYGEEISYLREAMLHKTAEQRGASVPKFLFAGLIPDGSFIIAMEAIRGLPLNKAFKIALNDGGLDAARSMYMDVEEAVLGLWTRGIFHADLHANNVMVRDDNSEPVIIDFGFAGYLPDELVQLMKTLPKGMDIRKKWMILQKYVDGVILERKSEGFKKFSLVPEDARYNPDGLLFRWMSKVRASFFPSSPSPLRTDNSIKYGPPLSNTPMSKSTKDPNSKIQQFRKI